MLLLYGLQRPLLPEEGEGSRGRMGCMLFSDGQLKEVYRAVLHQQRSTKQLWCISQIPPPCCFLHSHSTTPSFPPTFPPPMLICAHIHRFHSLVSSLSPLRSVPLVLQVAFSEKTFRINSYVWHYS